MTRFAILILAALMVSAIPAVASPLCTTGNLGAASYGAGGFSCQIGDNIFSGFTFGASGTGNTLTAASITIAPEVTASGIGFIFTGNFSVAGTGTASRAYTDTIQYIVNAPVTSLTAWFVNATTKVNAGATANGGTYSETKTVYSDAARSAIIDSVPSVTNATVQSQTSAIVGAPVITMYIKDQISLRSNASSVAATASFTSFENLYQTPEPGSMVLLGTGLIGFALALRRRKA